ncbi:MAG: adenylate/guanylate cyclase domain-containing protein [Chlorobia bacterium]|nr:adenylate/guanylate cyclase domain-containing protein [Fimbriimonadaceae bacterium]
MGNVDGRPARGVAVDFGTALQIRIQRYLDAIPRILYVRAVMRSGSKHGDEEEARLTEGALTSTQQLEAVRLALRMQQASDESLTLAQLEEIGKEAGVDPEQIRKAVEALRSTDEHKRRQGNRRDLIALVTSFLAVMLSVSFPLVIRQLPAATLIYIALAVGLGYVCKRPWVAAIVGFVVNIGYSLGNGHPQGMEQAQINQKEIISIISFTVFGLLGWGVNRVMTPKPPKQEKGPPDRAELVKQFVALQDRLEQGKVQSAVLCVDVEGSTGMKAGESDLDIEYSFNAYLGLVDEAVEKHGGKMESAAGDGAMAVFTTADRAILAAQNLVGAVEAFNANGNRLKTPFRVRCAISSGEIGFNRGGSIGRSHSIVFDRAGKAQKGAEPGGIVVTEDCREMAEGILENLEPVSIPGLDVNAYRSKV